MSRRPCGHRGWRKLGAAAGLLWTISGCCPTTAGPTGPMVSRAFDLAPGDVAYFDVETPPATTQVNLTFRVDPEPSLRFRQIDPGCVPGQVDVCLTFLDTVFQPRPSGVMQFSNTVQPRGSRTRLVLENQSAPGTVHVLVVAEPRRAGCT